MKAFLLFLGILWLGTMGACRDSKDSYGTRYGAPEAVMAEITSNSTAPFDGDAVTLLPEVKPVSPATVHHVRFDVTHKLIEIVTGKRYRAWTFGDDVPGPTIHVTVGDRIVFTLTNRSMEAVEQKRPSYVTFNGKYARHLSEPLTAKPGERVRLYVLNAGPNDTSSFHVIGTIFDRVWLEGNPANELRGLQTVLLGASNGAIVEFVIPEKGKYVFVDHEFADAHHGAIGAIDATQ